MERTQAQGIEETPGAAEAAHRSGCQEVYCGSRTHSEQPGRLPDLLDPTPVPIRRFRADGAYVHRSVYDRISRGRYRERRDCDPPSSLCGVPRTAPGRSVKRLFRGFARSGDGSGRRSRATDSRRVENSFFRYKSVFGGGLQARHSKAQRREAAIGCHILNQMAELGRLKSYAVVS